MILKRIPIRRVIDALERTAARFLDRDSPVRKASVTAISAETGFSVPVIELAVDRTFSELTGECARRLLIKELGGEDAADDPALPSPGRTLVIAAGSIFQPMISSVTHALLVKSAVTVKCSAHESRLMPIFVRILTEINPDIGAAVDVLPARIGKEAIDFHSDAVIAYGSDESLAAIRSRLPAGARWIGHGHKVSVAALGREVIESDPALTAAARALAEDIALYDQTGCLSPQCVYVETSGRRVAKQLAQELETAARRLPPGRLSNARAAAVQSVRNEFEFRSCMDDRESCFFGEQFAYTIVTDSDPQFRPSPLYRTILVKQIPDLADLPDHLRPISGHLQGVAVAPLNRIDPMENRLREMGASYFCEPGRLQRPPLHWPNGGIPCLRGLLG